ncbi:MAG: ATP-dependent zinc metalloprotease FtsH [Elusimicrobiota bacterium]
MEKKDKQPQRPAWLGWALGFLFLFWMTYLFSQKEDMMKDDELSYSEFQQRLQKQTQVSARYTSGIDNRNIIENIIIREDLIKGKYVTDKGEKRNFHITRVEDPDLVKNLEAAKVQYRGEIENKWWQLLIYNILPFGILIFIWWWLLLRPAQSGGKQVFSFGRSRAKMYNDKKKNITFKDVAGVDEAKEELQEIIEFLKDPAKFQKLGGKIPKGVILYGAPGTGKTLLAKAVAGEAGVPFFSSSGSEFVEMFVGVGASRVRDLFETGRKNAPCLLFVDEIDAVGRHRFAGIGGGHDEREQTLNQLLVEMDGFDTKEGVILIAATNRPDVLDPALLRPGRFDRHIVVPSPDLKGREEILRVHARTVKLDEKTNLLTIARRTPGFVGADLANLVNEAALLAARKNKKAVENGDMEEAIDRVIAGPERKSRMISDREKNIIAYHESGHALLAKLLPGADPVHKVSIIPRGPALGYTLQLPTEDRYLTTKTEIINRIIVYLGGHVAEKVVFSELTTGSQNDLTHATDMAHKMVCEFGMSDKIGPLTYGKKEGEVFLGRDIVQQREYSEDTAKLIDKEVKSIVEDCMNQAIDMLIKNRDKLDKLSSELVEHEVLDGDEVNKILGFPVENIYGEAEPQVVKPEEKAEDTVVNEVKKETVAAQQELPIESTGKKDENSEKGN